MPGAGISYAPRIVQLLKDESAFVRERAVETLGQMGKEAGKYAPDVAPLLSDVNPEVRDAAAKALEAMGGEQYLPKK